MSHITEKVRLTKDGFAKLKAELGHLENVLRLKNKERIKRARSFCDFNEDSEYEAALAEQRKINERINALQDLLSDVEIIDRETTKHIVTLGSTVCLADLATGEKETFTIVRAEEADSLSGKISEVSPLGSALMGAQINDHCEVITPNGPWKIKIEKIN